MMRPTGLEPVPVTYKETNLMLGTIHSSNQLIDGRGQQSY